MENSWEEWNLVFYVFYLFIVMSKLRIEIMSTGSFLDNIEGIKEDILFLVLLL